MNHIADITEDDPKRVRIKLALRTRQAQYVEYLAERDGQTFSDAVGEIIVRAIRTILIDGPGRTEKIRKHVMMTEAGMVFINQLAVCWGLPQSDVVRRLIDDALARDTTI